MKKATAYVNYILIVVCSLIILLGSAMGIYDAETKIIQTKSQSSLNEYYAQQRNRQIASLEDKISVLMLENKKTNELLKVNQINNELRDSEISTELNLVTEKPDYNYLKNITVYVKGEIPEKTKENGTVRVRQAWTGTGSILKIENGYTYILTNNHVTGYGEENFEEVILTVEENKYVYYADKVVNNPTYDVAIVRIKGVIPDKQAIRGFSETYKQQDKVYSVGHYLAIPYLYSEGTISGYNKDKTENILLVNLNVAGGCSGSAIVNAKGELVSVLFATYYVSMFSTDTARALSVPYLEFKDWLKENLK